LPQRVQRPESQPAAEDSQQYSLYFYLRQLQALVGSEQLKAQLRCSLLAAED
jgi:hypothetical protein